MITVNINGEERQYPQGATYEDVANDYQKEYDNLIALAARDGKIRELFKKLTRDCEITFFTLKDDVGNKTYVRSATMLFLKAVLHKYPAFLKDLEERHIHYNETLEELSALEKEGRVHIIRPSSPIQAAMIERDESNLERIYQIGRADMKKDLEKLKAYLDS